MLTIFILPASTIMYASGIYTRIVMTHQIVGLHRIVMTHQIVGLHRIVMTSAIMYTSGTTPNSDDSSDSGNTVSENTGTVQQQNTDFENTILNIHNQERAQVQVPALTWSNNLASDAQEYADYLVSLGLGPEDIPPHTDDNSQGENLAWGPPDGYTLDGSVQMWANEKSNFQAGHIMSASDFNEGVPMIGHYTQMVWSSTTEIGCGQANNADVIYLVCRYTPPGNMYGETPY